MINILETIVKPVKLQSAPIEVIKAVQLELVRIGLLDKVDGIPGPKTMGAFHQFKELVFLGDYDTLGQTTARKLLEYKVKRVTAEAVLKIASSYLGYKESPPNSNRTKFGSWYSMDGQPWCAIFVSFCFYQAGLPLPATTPRGFAYCPYGVNWFKQLKRFYKTPEVGDVVFFDFTSGRDGIADHVGIVEKVNSDGTVTTIEGNTSSNGSQSNGGAVLRKVRTPKNVVLGYGRPRWN